MFLSKSRQYPRHWASVPNGHTRLSIALAVSWCLVSPTAVAGRDPLPIRSLLLRHPGLGPFAVADPPQARLQLTTRQHTILSGVRDGTPLIDEAGLYLLLDQASRQGRDRILREAVTFRRKDLLADPGGHRGQLVKVHARYAETLSFHPSNRRRYADAAYSTLAWERDTLEPVSLVTVDDPGPIRPGADVILAGYFFKLRRDEPRRPDRQTGGTKVLVPVLVGRAVVVEQRSMPPVRGAGAAWAALVAAVVLLAGLWFWMRMRLKRQDRPGRRDRLRRHGWAEPSDPNAPENRPVDLETLARGGSSLEVAEDAEGPVAPGETRQPCASCGAVNRAAARYCDQCGAALAASQHVNGEPQVDENGAGLSG